MSGMEFILGVVILGALLGFFFSKKGHEKEGAIQGAKTSCGCLFVIFFLLIGALFFLLIMVSSYS